MNTPTTPIRLSPRTAICGGRIYTTADKPEHAAELAGDSGIIANEIRQRLAAFRPLTFWRSESGRLDYVELPETEKGGAE